MTTLWHRKAAGMKLSSFTDLMKDVIKGAKNQWNQLSPEQKQEIIEKAKELAEKVFKKD